MAGKQITFDILARDKASATFDKVGKHSDGLGKKMTGLGKAAALGIGGAAVGGVLALGLAMTQGVKDAASYQDLQNRTKNVLETTGNAANTSVAAILKRAGALETLSGVDEELIISSQNVLATFTKVRNGTGDYGTRIFDRATEAALNMSVALGTDLQGSTVMLGKALNDPIKGITAMSRAGVSFTEQQKAQIKTLVKSGQTMKAQQLILGELDKEFGNAAETAGKGFNGSMARVKDIVGDTFRDIGTKLLPTITKLADRFADNLPRAIDKVLAIGQRLSRWWTNDLGPALSKAKDTILPGVQRALSILSGGVGKNTLTWKQVGDVITQKIIPIVAKVASVYLPVLALRIRATIEVVKALWKAGQTLYSVWRSAISGVVGVFLGFVGTVVNGAARAFGWVPGLGPKLRNAAHQFNEFRDQVNRALNGTRSSKRIYVSAPGSSAVIRALADIRWQTAHIPRSVTIGVNNKLRGIPGFASGVTNFRGGMALVGERGPEIVTLPRGSSVHPNGSTVRAGGVVINISGALDPDAVGKQVQQVLLHLKRRNGGRDLGIA